MGKRERRGRGRNGRKEKRRGGKWPSIGSSLSKAKTVQMSIWAGRGGSMPVIPALWEAEAAGSPEVRSSTPAWLIW